MLNGSGVRSYFPWTDRCLQTCCEAHFAYEGSVRLFTCEITHKWVIKLTSYFNLETIENYRLLSVLSTIAIDVSLCHRCIAIGTNTIAINR